MISLEQKRAQRAWTFVSAAEKKCGDEYYSLIRGFPTRIQADGIGQAVAFLMSKRKEQAHTLLLNQMQQWLVGESELPWSEANRERRLNPNPKLEHLLEMLLAEPSAFWWLADHEAIEFCSWLKRYSEFHHPGKGGQQRAEGGGNARPADRT